MRLRILACLVMVLAASASFAAQPLTTITGPISVPLGYDQTNLRLVFWPSAPFSCDDTAGGSRWWVGGSRSNPMTVTVTDAFSFSTQIAPNTGYNNSPDLTSYTMQLQTPQGVTLYTVTGQVTKSATPITFASIVVNNPTTPVAIGPPGTALGPTTTNATCTVPAVSATVVVSVVNGAPFPNLSYVLVTDGSHVFAGQVTSGGTTNSITVTCSAILLGSAGNTMANGACFDFSGATGATGAGYTTTSGSFVIPAINSTVVVSVVSGTGLVNNSGVMIDDGSGGHAMLGLITSGGGTTSITVKNVGLTAGAVGNTLASGAITAASTIPYSALGTANQVLVGGALLPVFGNVPLASIQEIMALADLSDVSGKTGTGSTVVMDTSPTLITPILSGGTNYGPVSLNGSNTFTSGSAGTTGQVLMSQGSSSPPIYHAAAYTDTYPTTTSRTTATYTWTPHTGTTIAHVKCFGGGGSGAGGFGGTNAAVREPGTGGGGGAMSERWFNIADMPASVTVTVAAGGAGVATATNGNAGGQTSFGTLVLAYGGGAGTFTSGAATAISGGGGGGSASVGANGSTAGSTGGNPSIAGTGATGSTFGAGGGGSALSVNGGNAEFGGACGGGAVAGASAGIGGAGSIAGGAGGGAGGSGGSSASSGGAGGGATYAQNGGGAGGTAGGAGTAGTSTTITTASLHGGQGGGGGAGSTSTTGGAGAAGGWPSGGGGGGGGGITNGGAGGAGGDGLVVVESW